MSSSEQYIWRLPELTFNTARLLLDGYLEKEQIEFDIPLDIIKLWMYYLIDVDIINKIKNANRLQCFQSDIFCIKGFKFYIQICPNNHTLNPIHIHSVSPSFTFKDLFRDNNDENTDSYAPSIQSAPEEMDYYQISAYYGIQDDNEQNNDPNNNDVDNDAKLKEKQNNYNADYVFGDDIERDTDDQKHGDYDYDAVAALFDDDFSLQTNIAAPHSPQSFAFKNLFCDHDDQDSDLCVISMQPAPDTMDNDDDDDTNFDLQTKNASSFDIVLNASKSRQNKNMQPVNYENVKLDGNDQKEEDKNHENVIADNDMSNHSDLFGDTDDDDTDSNAPSVQSDPAGMDYFAITQYYGIMDDDVMQWDSRRSSLFGRIESEFDLYVHLISISPKISSVNIKCDIILYEKDIKIYVDFEFNDRVKWFRWHNGDGWRNNKRLKFDEIQNLETFTFEIIMYELNVTLKKDNNYNELMIDSYLPSQQPFLSISIGYNKWEIHDYLITENIKQNRPKLQSDTFFMDSIFPWYLQFNARCFHLTLNLKWFPCDLSCIYVSYTLFFKEANIYFQGYYKFDADNLESDTWDDAITRDLDIIQLNKFTFSVEIQLIDVYDKYGKVMDKYLVLNEYNNIISTSNNMRWSEDENEFIDNIDNDQDEEVLNDIHSMCLTDLINIQCVDYKANIKYNKYRNVKKQFDRYWFNKCNSNKHRHHATKHLYNRW